MSQHKKLISVDLRGDGKPFEISAHVAAEMFVAAKQALESNGIPTEGLDWAAVRRMEDEYNAAPPKRARTRKASTHFGPHVELIHV